MRRTRFSSLIRQSLTVLALAVVLLSTAWAKPKFKILQTVPGGLFSGLTFDAQGNLYGVTGAGGDYNHGTIFELTPGANGWTLTTIHSFDGQDGGTPNGGLIFDAAGNLYGTSPSGGTGGGNVFEMTPGSSGWAFNVLYNFCLQYHCPDGGGPQAGVIIGDGGNLYGTTAGGGSVGEGVVFELTSASETWDESVLYSFDGNKGKVGVQPYAPLIVDHAGILYGSTTLGGKISSTCYFGCGSVFRMGQNSGGSWTAKVLHSFDGSDGSGAFFGLAADSSGNLYGTTVGGGSSGNGVVFKLTLQEKKQWKEALLYEFPKLENGRFPSAGLVFDKTGNLYGTTSNGGNLSCSDGCGVVFKVTPRGDGKWKYTVLHKFTGQDGGYPGGGVVLDGNGNLYGTAYTVVYEITAR